MIDHRSNTTDAMRGQDLRTKVETRKHDLEASAAALPASDGDRRKLERVLDEVEGLLGGDQPLPPTLAAGLSAWLEASGPLAEYHPSAGVYHAGFVADLPRAAGENEAFRRVLYTTQHFQLVVMALAPGEELGAETHDLDQAIRVEAGEGDAILDGMRTAIRVGSVVVVPAGTEHDIVNTGRTALKLSTLYAPPNHRDGVVHRTRADAEDDDERFDGEAMESPRRVVS